MLAKIVVSAYTVTNYMFMHIYSKEKPKVDLQDNKFIRQ